uniref:Inner membrane protein YqjF n=1 Tax=Arsenophonus endosymbiont of Trialeurodes vaporariorum TaxID=235567 RepID=A0A3B0LZI8_9GAMM
MKNIENITILVARILMPMLFIFVGYGKLGNGYIETQQYMHAMGIPAFLLPLTILLEFGGGIAILLGFLTRTIAIFTVAFSLLTTFIFHFNFAEGDNQLMFLKDLSIAGGYMLLAILGPGKFSIDHWLNKNGNS